MLNASYGCIRFLRDGYKTAREDPNRLYYDPWELRMFDGIECQWPLFFTYLVIGACFDDNFDLAKKYMDQLEQIVLRRVCDCCLDMFMKLSSTFVISQIYVWCPVKENNFLTCPPSAFIFADLG